MDRDGRVELLARALLPLLFLLAVTDAVPLTTATKTTTITDATPMTNATGNDTGVPANILGKGGETSVLQCLYVGPEANVKLIDINTKEKYANFKRECLAKSASMLVKKDMNHTCGMMPCENQLAPKCEIAMRESTTIVTMGCMSRKREPETKDDKIVRTDSDTMRLSCSGNNCNEIDLQTFVTANFKRITLAATMGPWDHGTPKGAEGGIGKKNQVTTEASGGMGTGPIVGIIIGVLLLVVVVGVVGVVVMKKRKQAQEGEDNEAGEGEGKEAEDDDDKAKDEGDDSGEEGARRKSNEDQLPAAQTVIAEDVGAWH